MVKPKARSAAAIIQVDEPLLDDNAAIIQVGEPLSDDVYDAFNMDFNFLLAMNDLSWDNPDMSDIVYETAQCLLKAKGLPTYHSIRILVLLGAIGDVEDAERYYGEAKQYWYNTKYYHDDFFMDDGDDPKEFYVGDAIDEVLKNLWEMTNELQSNLGSCKGKDLYRQRIPVAENEGKSSHGKCNANELHVQGQLETIRHEFNAKLDAQTKKMAKEYDKKLAAAFSLTEKTIKVKPATELQKINKLREAREAGHDDNKDEGTGRTKDCPRSKARGTASANGQGPRELRQTGRLPYISRLRLKALVEWVNIPG